MTDQKKIAMLEGKLAMALNRFDLLNSQSTDPNDKDEIWCDLGRLLSSDISQITPIQAETFHAAVDHDFYPTDPITIYVRKEDLERLKGRVQVHFEGGVG